MKERKKKIVDAKYQVKGALSVIGISVSAFCLVLLILGTITYINNRTILKTMKELDAAVETEKHIITDFETYTKKIQSRYVSIAYGDVFKDHEESMKVIEDFSVMIKRTAQHNYYLLWIILAVVIIQAVILFIYMIRHTHTMAGPAFVIERYLDRILNDEDPDFRPLREGDAMTGIQEKLQRVHKEKLRKKRKKKDISSTEEVKGKKEKKEVKAKKEKE